MMYEAVLLFGIIFTAGLIFDLATQSQSPLAMRNWRQLYLFVVIGIYFTYFWGHGGQTLPMQTWRIKVVSAQNKAITFRQACIRYCGAWMWFLPALAISALLDIPHWASVALFFIGIVCWAITAKFDKNGQFLHDKWAGTQLIALPKKQSEDI